MPKYNVSINIFIQVPIISKLCQVNYTYFILKLRCYKQYFQCRYGACINKTYQCDGLKQCVDGSDELAEICDGATQTSIRIRRATK